MGKLRDFTVLRGLCQAQPFLDLKTLPDLKIKYYLISNFIITITSVCLLTLSTFIDKICQIYS
jgi:hypothetical protein